MTGDQLSRSRLTIKALVRIVAAFLVLVALFFLPAGTAAYWEAWVYVAVLFVPVTFVVIYLLLNDPELLARRMRTKEKAAGQSLIVKLGSVCYVLAFSIPGFDRRFGWSHVPLPCVVIADVIVLVGYGWFILVLKENSYASRVVEVEQGQRVVTTGPYSIVRHPMYLGVLIMFFSTPVALGSWWALVPAVPLVAVLVARIRNEERLLVKELEGYKDYTQATRYRLIPGAW